MDKMQEFKSFVRVSNAAFERAGIKLIIRMQCIRCGEIFEEEDIEKLMLHLRDIHNIDML